jgi:2-dehydropantoate 2-reductase
MKLLILGAGGIGGYFGGRLVQAGADVTFLVRPARQAQLLAHGLVIQSVNGDAALPVKTVLAHELGDDFELVLLTCKAYDLDDALASVAPAMAGRAALLPLLNGVAHMPLLSQRFGAARVLGGAAKIAITLKPDGAVHHLNDWSQLVFGEQDGSPSARALALKALFDRTDVKASVSGNIHGELWWKLVHLHTIAAMTSLMRANVGEIVRTPDGAALLAQLLDTNIEIATREGQPPPQDFVRNYRAMFSNPDSLYEASLARDMERGGRVEAEHILGDMLVHCRRHGLIDHLHLTAYTAAKAYEQRRAAQRLPR